MASSQEATRCFLGKLSLPVSRLMVRAAVHLASEVGQVLSFEPSEISQLELAVEEGFCNAVDHYSGSVGQDDHVHLEFYASEGELVISIREMGIPFDLMQAERYTSNSFEGMENAGLGTLLMESGMDSVELFVHGRDGKETRLTKKLRYGSLPEEFTVRDILSRGSKRPLVTHPVLRPGRLDELAEITRLAWRCYGYTQEELLYDVGLLTQKVRSGAFKPIVGFDPDSGTMISHIGLKYHDPDSKVSEVGLAFVDPKYRCPTMTKAFGRVAKELAREHGDAGIFDCSVTTHTFSQKAMQQHIGSRPCCIMFGIAAQGMQAKELATSKQEKGSVVNHYFAFDRSEATIYPPNRHKTMIQDIYGWLELPRVFAEATDTNVVELAAQSSLSVFPLPDELNVGFVVVHEIGADALQRVAEAIHIFQRERKDVVYAFLPLGTPHSPALSEQCEALGFSFAGIMPHIHGGDDRILLQWVGLPLALDQIRVYGDMSRRLLAYVWSEKERVEGL